MIRPLRKRHLFTWIFLAILLPIGFLAAISVIPVKDVSKQPLNFDTSRLLEPVVAEHSTPAFHFRFRSPTDTVLKQLEVQVKETIDQPSAFVYLSNTTTSSIDQAELVGSLAARGTYLFDLDTALNIQTVQTIFLYDKIKNEVFYKGSLSAK